MWSEIGKSVPAWKKINIRYLSTYTPPKHRYQLRHILSQYFFQFELVCGKSIYATLALAAVFVGFFVGAIIIGPFTDKFGRKPTIFISGFVIAVFSLVSAFPKVFWLFVVFKIIVGLGVGENVIDYLNETPDHYASYLTIELKPLKGELSALKNAKIRTGKEICTLCTS